MARQGPSRVSERDALTRAILDDPEADAPRLVFADWLEENGEADLGRYIRLSHEVRHLRPKDRRRAALEDEMYGLEATVGEAWADAWLEGLGAADAGALNLVSTTFERGQLTDAVIDAAAVSAIPPFRRALEHLLTRAPIRKAHVAFVSSAVLRCLARTPTLVRLRELELYGDDQNGGFATASSVALLARSPHLANLERLQLQALLPWRRRPRDGDPDEIAAALADSAHLANLKRLELKMMPLSDTGRKRLRGRFGERVSWGE